MKRSDDATEPAAGPDVDPSAHLATRPLSPIGLFAAGVLVSATGFGAEVVFVHRTGPLLLFSIVALTVVGALALRLAHIRGSARIAAATVSSRERRLTMITETLNDVVFISDDQGRMVFVSESIRRVFGVTVEDFLSRAILERLDPDQREQYLVDGQHLRDTPGASVHAELLLDVGDGDWRWLDARAVNLLDHPDVRGVITSVQDITERRAVLESLRGASTRLLEQATHDSLTGLPNRRMILDMLGTAMHTPATEGPLVAVLFCDLDLFKVVNDSLGHDVGDQLLPAVAGRFGGALADGQTLARFGGDEFVVLCEGLASANDAEKLAERLVASLREPIAVAEHRIKVATSIGVAVRRPEHDRPDALLRDADLAMYRAKETGRNRIEVFDDSLRDRALRRMSLEQSLRFAVERDKLDLAYQPVVSLEDGDLVGVEALLRWHSPLHGDVSPAEFVLIAEEIGFVIDLDEWVLDQACRQLADWAEPLAGRPFTLSVNISGRDLAHHDLVPRVRDALAANRVDPASLALEITETAVMADAVRSISVLDELRSLGVRLAVDDFGTGYSSLSYLRRLPVDTLKIDRTFVDGLGREAGDTEIVRLVVTLARTLGLATVAEGVETAVQVAELREIGCDMAQGFLLYRPMSASDVTRLLRGEVTAATVNRPDRRSDARPLAALDG